MCNIKLDNDAKQILLFLNKEMGYKNFTKIPFSSEKIIIDLEKDKVIACLDILKDENLIEYHQQTQINAIPTLRFISRITSRGKKFLD